MNFARYYMVSEFDIYITHLYISVSLPSSCYIYIHIFWISHRLQWWRQCEYKPFITVADFMIFILILFKWWPFLFVDFYVFFIPASWKMLKLCIYTHFMWLYSKSWRFARAPPPPTVWNLSQLNQIIWNIQLIRWDNVLHTFQLTYDFCCTRAEIENAYLRYLNIFVCYFVKWIMVHSSIKIEQRKCVFFSGDFYVIP